MPPGARIVMLSTQHMSGDARAMYFGPLARACGHAFTVVAGAPARFTTHRALDADVNIAWPDLQAALDQAP